MVKDSVGKRGGGQSRIARSRVPAMRIQRLSRKHQLPSGKDDWRQRMHDLLWEWGDCGRRQSLAKGKGWRGVVLKIIVAFTKLGCDKEKPSALGSAQATYLPRVRQCSLLTRQPQGVERTPAQAARAGGTAQYGSTLRAPN